MSKNPKLLFTALNTGSTMKGTLWELPDSISNGDVTSQNSTGSKIPERLDMKSIATLNEADSDSSTSIGAGVWDCNSLKLLTWPSANVVGDMLVWDIHSNSSAEVTHKIKNLNGSSQATDTNLSIIRAAAWDPHRPSSFTFARGDAIVGYDLRTPSSEEAFCIPQAHGICTRDVDYNPNKPYCFLSGGDDGKIKFWDYRKAKFPLRFFRSSHWVMKAKYNPFHDQLVVSAGTDSSVALWRAASISSAPLLELDDDDSNEGDGGDEEEQVVGGGVDVEADNAKDVADAAIRTFDEHEDSVYGLAWSLCDAWVFSSLSYDGRVVINHVPSTEKYKILL